MARSVSGIAEELIKKRNLTGGDRVRAQELANTIVQSFGGDKEFSAQELDRLWDIDTGYREALGRPVDPSGLTSSFQSLAGFSGNVVSEVTKNIQRSPEAFQQQIAQVTQGAGGGTPYTPFALPGSATYTPTALPTAGTYTPAGLPGAYQPVAGPARYQAAALPGAYQPSALPTAQDLYQPGAAPGAYQAADVRRLGPQALSDVSGFQQEYLNQFLPGRVGAVGQATQLASQLLGTSGELPAGLREEFLENLRSAQGVRGLTAGLDPVTEARQLSMLGEQVRGQRIGQALGLLGAQLGGPSFGELGSTALGIGAQGLQETGLREQQAQFGAGFGMDRARFAEDQARFGTETALRLAQTREQQAQFGFGAGMDVARFGEGQQQQRFASDLAASQFGAGQAQFGAGFDLDRARLAEDQARFGATFGEGQRQFGAQFGEGQRQFGAQFGLDLGRFGETQRQFGATAGLPQQQLALQNLDRLMNYRGFREGQEAEAQQPQQGGGGFWGTLGSTVLGGLGSFLGPLGTAGGVALGQAFGGGSQQSPAYRRPQYGYSTPAGAI